MQKNSFILIELSGLKKKINEKIYKWNFHNKDKRKITNGNWIYNSACFDPYVDVIKNI
jgi:hypothetical protein